MKRRYGGGRNDQPCNLLAQLYQTVGPCALLLNAILLAISAVASPQSPSMPLLRLQRHDIKRILDHGKATLE